MKKTIYCINIDVTGEEGDNKLSDLVEDGIKCNGFVILGYKSESNAAVMVHGVSTMDIAQMIAGSDELMAASCIAKALRDARDIQTRGKLNGLFDAMKKSIE